MSDPQNISENTESQSKVENVLDGATTIEKKIVDVLITNIIPTSKYFEARFDHLQYQLNEVKTDVHDLRKDMAERFDEVNKRFGQVDKRFEQVDKRFEQVDAKISDLKSDMDRRFQEVDTKISDLKKDMDKRFEQVDKRFEQVDKRFEQINERLDKLIERIDRRIDDGLKENREWIKNATNENRLLTVRLFTFSMTFTAISLIGLAGKIFNLF